MQPTSGGPCKFAIVLPSETHCCSEGMYLSEFGLVNTSAVRMEPSGIRVQPSSAFQSLLPDDPIAVHCSVLGSSNAICISNLRPIRNLPLGNTADGESPI